MKALFLLFCFGILPAFSTIHAASSFSEPRIMADIPEDQLSSREFLKYYKNGNLKLRQTVFYNKGGSECQTIFEAFRKNGTKRDCMVMNESNIIQYTKYNNKGRMKFERNYYYSGLNYLQSVETRKPNGDIQIWTQPPPERYVVHLYQESVSAKN